MFANMFGVKHTVAMADQALHDISNGLLEQAGIFWALNPNCRVVLLASAKGTIQNVGE